MKIAWFLILAQWCMTLTAGFDLGPLIRLAQCRSECLRKHGGDDSCDLSDANETVCDKCWKNCERLSATWEENMEICGGYHYRNCPECQTACTFYEAQMNDEYMPSMLPAPRKGPVSLNKYDVAIVLRRVHQQWQGYSYNTVNETPSLRPDRWIIVVTEDGLKHYSWQEWRPTLESLKEGPLFEATISWRDLQTQLKKQHSSVQKRFNDRLRQFFLEKYGEKVLDDQENDRISQEVFRRFFFRRKDSQEDESFEIDGSPSTSSSFPEHKGGNAESAPKESFVVSWEPETGGLMGNQVADSDSAQISLLPGTKYLVRIASNDGPGSFPIVVDTRSASPHVIRIKKNVKYAWELYVACTCAVLLPITIGLIKLWKKSKKNTKAEEV